MAMVNPKRIILLKKGADKKGPVVYWMQRDQRGEDNWALIYAQEQAIMAGVPLYVIFCAVPSFCGATQKHYSFMFNGLRKTELWLKRFNIPFVLLNGEPDKKVAGFITEVSAGILVTDFNPLKTVIKWKEETGDRIKIPFFEVDAHNIVPCREVSHKQEFAAYTIRPKLNKLINEFLEEFPPLVKMKQTDSNYKNDWESVAGSVSEGASGEKWFKPGEDEAVKTLQRFINEKFGDYNVRRNNPSLDALSDLSPYFHFGQIAPQRAALAAQRLTDYPESQKAFLEELIVRRELADNFCFYNKSYDSFNGFPQWGKDTLNAHRRDKREALYTLQEFEHSQTHDALWNAAQREMVVTGKMHGYMRMYWAKKILEWSPAPEDALAAAIYLNDKYELDGRDPNGYAGIAWAVGGAHDRPWMERNVFGKIRYMNLNGCKRKFDVDLYIEKINSLK